MNKSLIALSCLMFSVIIAACSSKQEDRVYKFRAISDETLLSGTSKLMLPDSSRLKAALSMPEGYGKYAAEFRGSLLQLFGEPLHISDAQYDYIIEASDSANHIWILTAYEGSSGPALGGDASNQSIYPVAMALRDLIEQTSPADFEDVFYSEEYDSTVTYGCKAGACNYREQRGNHVP